MMRLIRLSLITSIAVILSACGFSLRGSDILSSKFDTLQLNAQPPNSEFSRLLRRSLEVADVSVEAVLPENLDSELPVLAISNEQVVSRPVTVNPRARVAQYELRLSINVVLARADELLNAPSSRIFSWPSSPDVPLLLSARAALKLGRALLARSRSTEQPALRRRVATSTRHSFV